MDVGQAGHISVVRVHGELDIATVPALREALASQHGAVVLDLRGLEFIDGSGLRLLLEVDTRARQDGLELTLVTGRVVDRLFGLTETRERFQIHEESHAPAGSGAPIVPD